MSVSNLSPISQSYINKKSGLPEQLVLNQVTIFGENNKTQVLKSNVQNYYRATDVFGDTATKKDKYPNQPFIDSTLNLITKATKYVENVIANVKGNFTDKTARDAKMSDIFAKQIGTWTNKGKTIGGGDAFEKTDAYKFALSVNNDDYTIQKAKAYFDNSKSDNNITLFATEENNGKLYIAMKDSTGKIHYFDKSDNLKEVKS